MPGKTMIQKNCYKKANQAKANGNKSWNWFTIIFSENNLTNQK